MNIKKVTSTKKFARKLKKLEKKFGSIYDDLEAFVHLLKDGCISLMCIRPDIYKARLAISSSNKGKSGGCRVILFKVDNGHLRFISIYHKSVKESISNREILDLLKDEGLR